MKKLFIMTLLLATHHLLCMDNSQTEPNKNNWKVSFIRTHGRQIPEEIISFDTKGKRKEPVNPFIVTRILSRSKKLKKLFQKYGKNKYPDNASFIVAMLFAKGHGGYRTVNIKGQQWSGEEYGYVSVARGKTINDEQYQSFKQEFIKHNVAPLILALPKEILTASYKLFLSRFPEEKSKSISFNVHPTCQSKTEAISKLILYRVPYELTSDKTTLKFLIDK